MQLEDGLTEWARHKEKQNNKDRRLDERNGEYTYEFKKYDERDG
jgi:hypothetical protein